MRAALLVLALPSLVLAQQPTRRTHSDVRVSTHKTGGLPRLRPHVGVTPSHPDTLRVRVLGGGVGGEVVPEALPLPGSARRWPWLLVPIGAGAFAFSGRGGEGARDSTAATLPMSPVPVPVTTTPEPAPLAYELAALAVALGWLAARRRA